MRGKQLTANQLASLARRRTIPRGTRRADATLARAISNATRGKKLTAAQQREWVGWRARPREQTKAYKLLSKLYTTWERPYQSEWRKGEIPKRGPLAVAYDNWASRNSRSRQKRATESRDPIARAYAGRKDLIAQGVDNDNVRVFFMPDDPDGQRCQFWVSRWVRFLTDDKYRAVRTELLLNGTFFLGVRDYLTGGVDPRYPLEELLTGGM